MPKSRNPVYQFDKLKMYFGKPYEIDCKDAEGTITVYQPTIGNIVEFGEQNFYNTLHVFIANTTSYRLPLWEIGLDWNQLADFDLFILLYQQVDPEATRLIFGDLDFSKFELYKRKDDSMLLKHADTGVEITEDVYLHFSQYLQNVFNIHPEEKMTDDPVLKQWYIDKDKSDIHNKQIKRNKGEYDSNSSLLSVISSCVNHPGFKYNIEELTNVGVCQFFDSVSRLQVYESSTALLKGMYSGFIDSKGIDSNAYNFMKEI